MSGRGGVREKQGLSTRQVATQAGLSSTTIIRIELGRTTNPRPEVLRAIADALGLDVSDTFKRAGIVHTTDLPPLPVYLRSKYRYLPEDAVLEVEAFLQTLRRRHGAHGADSSKNDARKN